MLPITILRNSNGQLIRQALRVSKASQRASTSMMAPSVSNGSGYFQDVWNLLNQRREEVNSDRAYSMAFGDDSTFSLSSMVEPSALMQEQLRISEKQLRLQRALEEEAATVSKKRTYKTVQFYYK